MPKSQVKATSAFPQNQTKNNSVATCPSNAVNTRQECDIDGLKISVKEVEKTSKGEKEAKVKEAEIKPRSAAPPIPNYLDKWHAADLLAYDQVIEVMADGPGAYDASKAVKDKPENIVKIAITPTPLGRCPNAQHLKVAIEPRKSDQPSDKKEWIAQTPPEECFLANANPGDQAGPERFLAPFWCFANNTKELVIRAEACGVRKQGKPVKQLKSLVRIYPKDVYSLNYELDPAHSITRKAKWQKDLIRRDLPEEKSGKSVMEFSTESKTWTGVIANRYTKTVKDNKTGTNYTEKSTGVRNTGLVLLQRPAKKAKRRDSFY